jgi:hypothetical protein
VQPAAPPGSHSRATLVLVYRDLTSELRDVHSEERALGGGLNGAPAVSAITLAILTVLATVPLYHGGVPSLLVAFGLVPFVAIAGITVGELRRTGLRVASDDEVATVLPEDHGSPEAWLVRRIADRRLETATARHVVARRRRSLAIASIVLAAQVVYLIGVAVVFALASSAGPD